MVPAEAVGLHAGFILKAHGRWNRAGVYGCLYTALTREGALAELARYARRAGLRPDRLPARDLVSIRVRVEPVLDLTSRGVRRKLGATLAALTGDGEEDLEACRSLADFARQQGYCAILSPSAALRGAANLNLYIDGPAGQYDLDHGPDRIPITHRDLPPYP